MIARIELSGSVLNLNCEMYIVYKGIILQSVTPRYYSNHRQPNIRLVIAYCICAYRRHLCYAAHSRPLYRQQASCPPLPSSVLRPLPNPQPLFISIGP